jgi:hypothetical protein
MIWEIGQDAKGKKSLLKFIGAKVKQVRAHLNIYKILSAHTQYVADALRKPKLNRTRSPKKNYEETAIMSTTHFV